MRMHLVSLASAFVLVTSTASLAQDITHKPITGADRKKSSTQPASKPSTGTDAAPTVQPETPAKTQTTTTQSTTSTTAIPDQSGIPVAVQKTTDTRQTTTTQPANSSEPVQSGASHTTSTTTVSSDETGTPSATTTTTTTEPAKDKTGTTITAATAADIKAGVPVFDQKGGVVGKVDSVSSKGAVVNTGSVKATIPAASFAKNDKGLVISMSKTEIDAAAKPAKATKKPK